MSHVLITGPVTGTKTLADGTVYDVTPGQIECQSQEHALELADLIGKHHEVVGHPDMVEDGVQKPFVYDPAVARTVAEEVN